MSEEILTTTPSDKEESTTDINNFFEVGDRKYTVDTAKKKIENADQHIQTLEQENAAMREQLAKATTMDQVLEALKGQSSSQDSQETPSQVSADDIATLVEQVVSNKSAQQVAETNLKETGRRMTELFGDKTTEVINKVGMDLGLGEQTLKDIASKSPDAFVKLFEKEPSQITPQPTTSNINTETVTSSTPDQGTYAWYEQIRKTNPKLYHSKKVQDQMFQDANRLGQEKFMGIK